IKSLRVNRAGRKPGLAGPSGMSSSGRSLPAALLRYSWPSKDLPSRGTFFAATTRLSSRRFESGGLGVGREGEGLVGWLGAGGEREQREGEASSRLHVGRSMTQSRSYV